MTYQVGEGTTVGAYQLEAPIGRGGMAEVWRAYNTSLGRHEAVKFIASHLSDDRELVERFLNETRVVAGLAHPNIVTIFTVSNPQEARPYYAMELLPGPSLSGYLRQRGRLSPRETIEMLSQVAEALDFAHARGIVHRDIKPSNLLIAGANSGGGPLVKVLDFGIAKILQGGTHGSPYTRTGVIVGTPDYMAPEQASARFPVSAATDQYALACVAYELLTGQPPFPRGADDTDITVLMRHVTEPIPDPSQRTNDLSPGARHALMTALAKEPGQRFPSCRAFLQALAQPAAPPIPHPVQSDHPITPVIPVPPVTPVPPTRPVPPQNPWQTPGPQQVVAPPVPHIGPHSNPGQPLIPPPGMNQFYPGVHSPGIALLLHVFAGWVSGGEFYNRQIGKAILNLAISIAMTVMFFVISVAGSDSHGNVSDETGEKVAILMVAGFILGVFRLVDVLVVAGRLSTGNPVGKWDWCWSPRRNR